MKPKTTHFGLRLPHNLKQAAEKAAADDQRPLSSLVKKLLSDHCREREPAAAAPAKKGVK